MSLLTGQHLDILAITAGVQMEQPGQTGLNLVYLLQVMNVHYILLLLQVEITSILELCEMAQVQVGLVR